MGNNVELTIATEVEEISNVIGILTELKNRIFSIGIIESAINEISKQKGGFLVNLIKIERVTLIQIY